MMRPGSPPPAPPDRRPAGEPHPALRGAQYTLIAAFFGCLIAIVWFPEQWWKLLITGALLLGWQPPKEEQ